jgi:hypothetical protein
MQEIPIRYICFERMADVVADEIASAAENPGVVRPARCRATLHEAAADIAEITAAVSDAAGDLISPRGSPSNAHNPSSMTACSDNPLVARS